MVACMIDPSAKDGGPGTRKGLTSIPPPPDAGHLLFENQLMTYAETAAYLRYSESYLRRLVSKGKIPHIKRGRTVRFRVASLDRWNQEREVT